MRVALKRSTTFAGIDVGQRTAAERAVAAWKSMLCGIALDSGLTSVSST